MTYKHFKKVNLTCSISSAVLVVAGATIGALTLNPIVIGCVTGSGVVLKTYCEVKNYRRKIEMSKFAYTTYQKILSDIRFSLRGGNFDEIQFFNNVRLSDDIVIDLCLLPQKYDKKYNKILKQ